jgi:hypothetical protein
LGDLEVREWIAFGIVAALFTGAAVAGLVYRQRAHWRKLRMAGSSEAKRRELQKRR